MRIYAAGFYSFTRQEAFEEKADRGPMEPFRDYDPDWALESYHYITKRFKMLEWIRRHKRKIFLDSGAFSAFTQGVNISLEEYAAFIKEWQDVIETASNVDIIGRGNEAGSYENQKKLEALGAKVQPVHHARDKDDWLKKYLDEGYDYIFLGGMVPETTQYLKEWLDRIWGDFLTNPDGTPKVKVHGFGLTTESLMYRYPWFSVDSTSWLAGNMQGSCMIDMKDPYGKPITQVVAFAQEHINKVKYDKHYDTLSPAIQKEIAAIVEKHGYTVDLLRTKYGARSKWNIDYYKRNVYRAVKTFIPEQKGFF